jgi:hypothetical protein
MVEGEIREKENSMHIEHYSTVLLYNFNADVEEIVFENNLRVVNLHSLLNRACEGKLSKAATEVIAHLKDDLSVNYVAEYHFEGEVEEPFNKNYNRDMPAFLFNDVLTSLRLLKDGMIEHGMILNYIDGDPSGLIGVWGKSNFSGFKSPIIEAVRPYEINKGELYTLKSIFTKVRECKNEQIRIALNRLNRIYERECELDRLIDIIIAFEALYLKGIKVELQFRLAARAAHYLGRNSTAETKQKIFDCFKRGYDWRSKILHGVKSNPAPSSILLKDVLVDLCIYLRQTLTGILLYIGVENYEKDFHEKLDKAVITGKDFS